MRFIFYRSIKYLIKMPVLAYDKSTRPKPPDLFFTGRLTNYKGDGHAIPEGKKVVVIRDGEPADVDSVQKGDIVLLPEDGIHPLILSSPGSFRPSSYGSSIDDDRFPENGGLIRKRVLGMDVYLGEELFGQYVKATEKNDSTMRALDDMLKVISA